MKQQLILVALAFLLLAPMVCARSSISTSTLYPLTIVEPPSYDLKANMGYIHRISVYNATTGVPLNNSQVNCSMLLADRFGTRVGMINPMDYDATAKIFRANFSAGNFTEFGDYTYLVKCTDTDVGAVSTGSFFVSETGYGFPKEFVLAIFIIAFIILMALFLNSLIESIGRFASFNLDALDVAKSVGIYFGLLAMYQMSLLYLGSPQIESWLLLFIKVGGFTHLLIPITGLVFSMMIGSFKKKDVAMGTQRIYRGGRNGIKV